MLTARDKILIEDFCKEAYKTTGIGAIVAESTFERIENGILTLHQFLMNAVDRPGLGPDLRKRLYEFCAQSPG
jgi:hypothetical protein